jgi:GTP-binding protein YchF
MEIGIIGLPNSGKSTLFKALTGNDVVINLFPFSTVNPNIGIVTILDERLDLLAKYIKHEKIIPATIKFIDLAGLVKNAHKGEGLGNKFLSETRRADGLVEVVRCFEEKNVPHVEGSIDPVRDIEIIHIEIALSDFEIVEKNFEKIDHAYRSGHKDLKLEYEALSFAKENLKKGLWLNELNYPKEFNEIYKKYNLLTIKPLILIGNVGDEDIFNGESENFKKLKDYAQSKGYKLLKISLKFEVELLELNELERESLLKDLNIKEKVLDKLIKESYNLLDLITFFTYANNIIQAWSIKKGANVKEAAGKIHTDFEKGFVKAEVFNFEDLKKVNSIHELREKGLIKIEGKEYIVKDGDVIYFKINI